MLRGALMVLAVQGCAPSDDGVTAPEATEIWVLEELGPPQVVRMGLDDGTYGALFRVPSQSFAYELAFDPFAENLLLAYSPPQGTDGESYDRSQIASAHDGTMERLICADEADVGCSYPAIASDAVWFVESGPRVAPANTALSRWDRATGLATSVIPEATEPAVSPTGEHLAWIAVDPVTGIRSLELGDGAGTPVRTLVSAGTHADIGLPFFAADGQSVFFLVLEPQLAWLDRMLGFVLPTASAHASHDGPSDWWRVPLEGGPGERITTDATIIYDGRADPGGDWIFAATREGIVQVDLTTGAATLLVAGRAFRALDLR